MQNPARRFECQRHRHVIQNPAPALHESDEFISVVPDSLAHSRTNHRIQARAIPASRQHPNPHLKTSQFKKISINRMILQPPPGPGELCHTELRLVWIFLFVILEGNLLLSWNLLLRSSKISRRSCWVGRGLTSDPAGKLRGAAATKALVVYRVLGHLFMQLSKFLRLGSQIGELAGEILAMSNGRRLVLGIDVRIRLIRRYHRRVLLRLGQVILCLGLVELGDALMLRRRLCGGDQAGKLALAELLRRLLCRCSLSESGESHDECERKDGKNADSTFHENLLGKSNVLRECAPRIGAARQASSEAVICAEMQGEI